MVQVAAKGGEGSLVQGEHGALNCLLKVFIKFLDRLSLSLNFINYFELESSGSTVLYLPCSSTEENPQSFLESLFSTMRMKSLMFSFISLFFYILNIKYIANLYSTSKSENYEEKWRKRGEL